MGIARHALRLLSAALLFTAGSAAAVPESGTAAHRPVSPPRDPFWPLDYRPPTAQDPSVKASPAAAEPQRVSEEEWAEAERAAGIRPARYSMVADADGSAFLLLQGKIKTKGDLVNHLWKGVEFSWRVVEIAVAGASFERVRAQSPAP